ncbi:MAG: P-type DNA transfer ATPase VirB11 [Sphingomonas sp.]|uniref:P-type DNA transfer ATPase VirB11 n=1 Tax=Sphingomonas sp. TaxID=28214 RepID=UPI0025D7224F|nr:P-type DNA transfer ATPase VirB11 [Sphingomonas sp.]MBX9881322.1 P-type DNA transfer ATPase VirB11 [Sphingomonas sp.]
MSDAANDPAGAPPRYLDAYLGPLLPVLARGDVTDIYINRPGELWIETLGGALEHHLAPELTEAQLWRLARQIAALAHQGISREHPLLSATLPDGSRVQVVAPPATRGDMAIAIRKHVVADLRLSDYAAGGAFAGTRTDAGAALAPTVPSDPAMLDRFLAEAVRARRNILVSGGTSTGKTTFLNALIKEIPPTERLLLIEDTPELQLTHANAVGLVAVRGELREARVTQEALLQASLRMRPDRIILGELRGAEAYTFLRAVNTGHPGSLTTLHADSPEGAIEQLALLILQSGAQLRREDIVHYVLSVIDIFVQLDRVAGRRVISRITTPAQLRRDGAR